MTRTELQNALSGLIETVAETAPGELVWMQEADSTDWETPAGGAPITAGLVFVVDDAQGPVLEDQRDPTEGAYTGARRAWRLMESRYDLHLFGAHAYDVADRVLLGLGAQDARWRGDEAGIRVRSARVVHQDAMKSAGDEWEPRTVIELRVLWDLTAPARQEPFGSPQLSLGHDKGATLVTEIIPDPYGVPGEGEGGAGGGGGAGGWG